MLETQDGKSPAAPVPNKPDLVHFYRYEGIEMAVRWFGRVTGLAMLVTIFLFWHFGERHRFLQACLLVLWTLLMPLWFCFEHFFLFQRWGRHDNSWAFARAQDLTAKFWLASIAVLTALFKGF